MPGETVEMPKNTSTGLWIGIFGFLCCFGIIWHIWWLSMTALVGVFATIIVRLSQKDTHYEL
jgi:cytochrome o ubiquinol oxidase subunit 1